MECGAKGQCSHRHNLGTSATRIHLEAGHTPVLDTLVLQGVDSVLYYALVHL